MREIIRSMTPELVIFGDFIWLFPVSFFHCTSRNRCTECVEHIVRLYGVFGCRRRNTRTDVEVHAWHRMRVGTSGTHGCRSERYRHFEFLFKQIRERLPHPIQKHGVALYAHTVSSKNPPNTDHNCVDNAAMCCLSHKILYQRKPCG